MNKRVDTLFMHHFSYEKNTKTHTEKNIGLEEAVHGRILENESGTYFAVEETIQESAWHGCRCFRDLCVIDMDKVATLALDSELARFDISDGLFLDLETTGLAGGTGTVPFMIGLGYFEGSKFKLQQLFARDYNEERAVLTALQKLAHGKNFLVTFNGKAFDINLLSTRFIMNRLPNTFDSYRHCDLLPICRKLFSHRLADRSLLAVEETILGYERENDVPGYEIPKRYFLWLNSKNGLYLKDVFLHNKQDILSMVALIGALTELISPGININHHPGDLLQVGRMLLHQGKEEEAFFFFKKATEGKHSGIARDARKELSLLYKRKGNWTEATAIWEDMLRRNPADSFAAIELAKWYEHHVGRPDKALVYTEMALDVTDQSKVQEELEHRKKRLLKKISNRETFNKKSSFRSDYYQE
ncbi:MAG: ribonuclease H-like domain-containing protein [Syntrophales bacterium]|nr:ribonuclease H-like domain-containing protein [Syntrophales bacterium]